MQHTINQVTADPGRESQSRNEYDLSIILNLHDEARYLRRTMRSLEDAAMFAQRDGSAIELVVVLDNPDPATRAWIDVYDFSYFDAHQVIVAANRSLGASRNGGVRAARGQYLATADGDDLVSYNMYAASLTSARADSNACIFVPEYMIGFGDESFVARHFGSEHLSPAVFFDTHPYCSRILASADLFRRLPYFEIQKGDGYAFEDWHFNCEALANGCSIAVSPGTILFYRKRHGSIMRWAAQSGSHTIPPSALFEPSTYKSLFERYETARKSRSASTSGRAPDLSADTPPEMLELVAAANTIEPAIAWENIRTGERRTNLGGYAPVGNAYLRAVEQLGERRFTDIVLVDGLARGGAEKFILDVAGSLQKLGTSKNVLVLSGTPLAAQTHQVSDNVTVLDLAKISRTSNSETIDILTLRLIQATSSGARIHLKSNEYSRSFLERFGKQLKDERVVYYYFTDFVSTVNNARMCHGFNFATVADFGAHISLIVSDHERNLRLLRATLDTHPASRLATIYAKTALIERLERQPQQRTGRLLWASRISQQKRPDLLVKIAERLASTNASISIDVFGLSEINLRPLKRSRNITYRGNFETFSELQPERYDGFIYTSSFDGLPNVLLEAMAHGLPVIAPDIGGISEAITNSTGLLVEDDVDDEVLAERYHQAINALYDADTGIESKLENARNLIRERHSEEAHMRRVSEVFSKDEPGSQTSLAAGGERAEAPRIAGGRQAAADRDAVRDGDSVTGDGACDERSGPDIAELETLLAERDALIWSLRRELQEQRARTLHYAKSVHAGRVEQVNVSRTRSTWRRIRTRLGLPRLGSLRRGLRAFAAVVFHDRP